MPCIKICVDLCKNHEGSVCLAMEMVGQAAAAGVDYIKIQAHDGLRLEDHLEILKHIKSFSNAGTIYTVRKESDLALISDGISDGLIDAIKIGSAEAINKDLIKATQLSSLPLVISTGGMGIEESLQIGRQLRSQDILCECLSHYPSEIKDLRLGVVKKFVDLGIHTGFSYHHPSIYPAIAAAGAGARYIEVHFTLSRYLPGQAYVLTSNHTFSMEPKRLTELVSAIKVINCALSITSKVPTAIEIKNLSFIREFRCRENT